ncbi:coagulation factor XIII B chain-like [Rhinophrynus dorsalis]
MTGNRTADQFISGESKMRPVNYNYNSHHPMPEKSCDLPAVENGRIALYFYTFKNFYFPMKEGKKLSVSCAAGYTSQSGKQEEQIACTADGWEPAPICFKKCIKPSLENGNLHSAKESYKILEIAHYSCSEGYITPSGNQTEEMQCLSNGWSPPPGCHQISDRCEAPNLDNGQYSTTKRIFYVKEILQYRCDEGHYTASGTTTDQAECLPRGWSSIPRCIKMNCEKLESVENGGFYPSKATYFDRDVVQFFCRENYSLRGSELIQCYSFGWYPKPPTCEERMNKCPPPPRPAHTILLTDPAAHRSGDSARYECDHNYILIGSEEILCENGQWTSPPSCVELKEKIKCEKPPTTENGEAVMKSGVYYSGDSAHYQCAEGYGIDGSNEITCKLGRWPEPPKCNAKREFCQSPPHIQNGEFIDVPASAYSSGSSVEYKCHSYHLMEGSKTVHCLHGTWTELPACLEPCTVSVDQMGHENIEMKWSFEINLYILHGDMVEFLCKDGYVSPNSEIKGRCHRGKMIYPTCNKKDTLKTCGPPPFVTNSRNNSSQEYYESGSSVAYTCSEYHFLHGSSTVQCLNGNWSFPPTCIEPCALSAEEMNRNHIKLRWLFDDKDYFFHGEFVEFLCKEGYQKPQLTDAASRVKPSKPTSLPLCDTEDPESRGPEEVGAEMALLRID